MGDESGGEVTQSAPRSTRAVFGGGTVSEVGEQNQATLSSLMFSWAGQEDDPGVVDSCAILARVYTAFSALIECWAASLAHRRPGHPHEAVRIVVSHVYHAEQTRGKYMFGGGF